MAKSCEMHTVTNEYGKRGVDMTARAKKVHDLVLGEIVEINRYEAYDKRDGVWGTRTHLDPQEGCSYSDLRAADLKEYLAGQAHDLLMVVQLACGSDYSGSTVQLSNYRALVDGWGKYAHDIWGDYSSYGVAFDLDWVLGSSEESEELLAALANLTDYPVLDDDLLYRLEADNVDEAWSDWACYDFTRALEATYEVSLDVQDDGAFRLLFETARDCANEYWVCEGSGTSMWIDVKRVAKVVTRTNLEQFLEQPTIEDIA